MPSEATPPGLDRTNRRTESAFDLASLANSESDEADAGPEVTGPLDVGDVLVAGAGAVGSCLLYWLREIGVVGSWDVVDGDIIKLHNTNRSLGFMAADAGWPTGDPAQKAQQAAHLISATPHVQWYHECIEIHPTSRPDLVTIG